MIFLYFSKNIFQSISIVNEKYDIVASSAPEFQWGDKKNVSEFQKEFIEQNESELLKGKVFYKVLRQGKLEQYDITLGRHFETRPLFVDYQTFTTS